MLCAFLALCMLLGACTGAMPPEQTTGQLTEAPTQAPTESESETEPVQDEDYPTADDLNLQADYTKLLISSVYAGATSKSAPVERNYVCFYNTGRVALPLQGLSIFVCGSDYVWREYPLPYGAEIPAGGYYLVLGKQTGTQLTKLALQTDQSDALRTDMLLGGDTLRLAIAPVGTQLPIDQPLAGQNGVVDYVSTHVLDSLDARHYLAAGYSCLRHLYRAAPTEYASRSARPVSC
jgi:hypothetical protein